MGGCKNSLILGWIVSQDMCEVARCELPMQRLGTEHLPCTAVSRVLSCAPSHNATALHHILVDQAAVWAGVWNLLNK